MNKVNLLPPFKRFCVTIGNLPSSYVDSMSYYECIMWLCKYLKDTVIPAINENAEAVNELQGLFTQLQNYVENYFENLDVQEEIDNKLDEYVTDGTLARIINDELLTEINNKYDTLDTKVDNNYNDLSTQITNQGTTLNNAIYTQNLVISNNNYAQDERIDQLEDRIDQIASGSPKVVSSTDDMTDHNQIYVLSSTGKWYYWDGDSWEIGGDYQAAVSSDDVALINKQLDLLSMNYALNPYETKSSPSSSVLPFTKTRTNSQTNAMEISSQAELSAGWFTTDSSKYYLIYAEIERLLDDTATQGTVLINPYLRSNTSTVPTLSWEGNRANIVMTAPKGEKHLISYCFKTSSNVDITTKILFQGTGTSEKTVSYSISKIGILAYNSLEEVNKANTNKNYIEQLGMIIPNDKYGNDKYDTLEARVDELEVPDYDTDILFWGDSLTQGAGGSGTNFPSVVGTILNKEVINAGVGGESSTTILARQGSITPVIPASANCSAITLRDINGFNVDPLIQGNIGVNPIKIDNSTDEYTLSRNQDGTYAIKLNNNVISSTNYPRFIRFAGNDLKGRITVLFVGQNGQGGDTLVNEIRTAIKNTNGKVVIMGLTTGTTSSRTSLVTKLKNEFGSKFFDSGYYLSQYGMNVVGLTPTSADTSAIAQGSVPPSLLSDTVHLNANGYTALGTLLAHFIASLYY